MGRFYKINQHGPIEDYAYELPFKELFTMQKYKRAEEEKADEALKAGYDKILNLNYKPGDEAKVAQLRKNFENLSNNVYKKYGNNLANATSSINQGISEVMDAGLMSDINANYKTWTANEAAKAALYKSGQFQPNYAVDQQGARPTEDAQGRRRDYEQYLASTDIRPGQERLYNNIPEDQRTEARLKQSASEAALQYGMSNPQHLIQRYGESIVPIIQAAMQGNKDAINEIDSMSYKMLEETIPEYVNNAAVDLDGNSTSTGDGDDEAAPFYNYPMQIDKTLTNRGSASVSTEDFGMITGKELGGRYVDIAYPTLSENAVITSPGNFSSSTSGFIRDGATGEYIATEGLSVGEASRQQSEIQALENYYEQFYPKVEELQRRLAEQIKNADDLGDMPVTDGQISILPDFLEDKLLYHLLPNKENKAISGTALSDEQVEAYKMAVGNLDDLIKTKDGYSWSKEAYDRLAYKKDKSIEELETLTPEEFLNKYPNTNIPTSSKRHLENLGIDPNSDDSKKLYEAYKESKAGQTKDEVLEKAKNKLIEQISTGGLEIDFINYDDRDNAFATHNANGDLTLNVKGIGYITQSQIDGMFAEDSDFPFGFDWASGDVNKWGGLERSDQTKLLDNSWVESLVGEGKLFQTTPYGEKIQGKDGKVVGLDPVYKFEMVQQTPWTWKEYLRYGEQRFGDFSSSTERTAYVNQLQSDHEGTTRKLASMASDKRIDAQKKESLSPYYTVKQDKYFQTDVLDSDRFDINANGMATLNDIGKKEILNSSEEVSDVFMRMRDSGNYTGAEKMLESYLALAKSLSQGFVDTKDEDDKISYLNSLDRFYTIDALIKEGADPSLIQSQLYHSTSDIYPTGIKDGRVTDGNTLRVFTTRKAELLGLEKISPSTYKHISFAGDLYGPYTSNRGKTILNSIENLLENSNLRDRNIVLTGSFRTEEYNSTLPNGAEKSEHMRGNSFDIGKGGAAGYLVRNAYNIPGVERIEDHEDHYHVVFTKQR